ncbi:TPA: hypothetical protein DEG21_02315 [Patescibacteria group bacterium]|nr:hypothetical protein [Candidatus Gracilibacteria bacterium]
MKIKFNPETVTLILEIDNKAIDLNIKRIEAEKLDLLEKKEFHFTIIGSKTGEEILKSLENLSKIKRNEILDKIRKTSELINWIVNPENNFYYLENSYNNPNTIFEKRKSIIQVVTIDKINEFYEKLNSLLKKQFEVPFPHITLFTNSTREETKLR